MCHMYVSYKFNRTYELCCLFMINICANHKKYSVLVGEKTVLMLVIPTQAALVQVSVT